ncbi:MAG: hypothetical protein LCH41_01320 [Armatimonadetes bacterium]|nr:hypothetical protein [Armatimonadota bacterium]
MKYSSRFLLATLALSALSGAAHAQFPPAGSWVGLCLDPANTAPYSTPAGGIAPLGTELMLAGMGTVGTVTMGGQNGPCFAPSARTLDFPGRFAFGVGGEGSVQSTFDDEMAYTMGWPDDTVGDFAFARILVDDTSWLFGDGGLNSAFVGASKRYIQATDSDGSTTATMTMRILADAARLEWRILNTGTEDTTIGLYWAFVPAMRVGGADHLGNNVANWLRPTLPPSASKFTTPDGYQGFTTFEDGRPIRTEKRRDTQDPDFPSYLRVYFGQTEAYGLRIDNEQSASAPDHSQADYIRVGDYASIFNNALTYNLTQDPTGTVDDQDTFLGSFQAATSITQRFPLTPVPAGETRTVIHYMRSSAPAANYADPYTVVLDSPKALNFAPGSNVIPPLQFRLWIDNQYATIDREAPLFNVKCTINLPAGLSLAPGESRTKFISRIDPNGIIPIDWGVRSDGTTYGDLPFTVDIEPTPGPKKTLSSTVRIASRPVISMNAGPNMVALPYDFGDNNLDRILGLLAGVDYVAYEWNSALRGYSPVQNIQRGLGYWIVPTNAQTNLNLNSAQPPSDTAAGGVLVQLQPGWNMIGNPYNYAVPLKQLNGISPDIPGDNQTWLELVSNQVISANVSQFVPNASLPGGGSYQILPENGQILEPHKAYWVFVNSTRTVSLIWPPLFQETLPDAGRSVVDGFAQTDRDWKLQLAARSTSGYDAANFVGATTDRKKAQLSQLPKVPMAPGQKLEMAVMGEMKGAPTRMAQSISDRQGRQEWKVEVKAEESGEVTVTWPNLPSVPRSLRLKMTDDVTGEKRDLRTTSGYTFRMDQPGTRSLTITAEPGGLSKPTIGNVVVQPAGRGNNSPVVINYALSADASVTVRVLSTTGKEIYMVTRGRSDSAGDNSVTWSLRDNANRAVAPGTYNVEIIAESPNGEVARRIVPVNVIR